jgi:hypothetical protein
VAYRTVFDVSQEGYAAWWFPAFGLIFVAGGALLVFAPALMLRLLPSGLQGRARRGFSGVFFAFAILWTAGSFFSTYSQYRTATSALADGAASVVEGPVTHFTPMPYTGHSQESFVVGDRRFSYSDYIVSAGFHNTASHGGPIHEGLNVRVTYLGNLILRLEVAE